MGPRARTLLPLSDSARSAAQIRRSSTSSPHSEAIGDRQEQATKALSRRLQQALSKQRFSATEKNLRQKLWPCLDELDSAQPLSWGRELRAFVRKSTDRAEKPGSRATCSDDNSTVLGKPADSCPLQAR